MAQSASKDAVRATMKPPEYRAALKRLTSVGPLKKQQAQGAKKIDDIYNAAETVNGVCKTASQFFLKIQGSDDAEKLRIFRDINGLLEADGTPTSGSDMVDLAQGKEVSLRLAHNADAPETMEESDFGDEANAIDDDDDDTVGDDTVGDDAGDEGACDASGSDVVAEPAGDEAPVADKPLHERMKEATDATAAENSDLMGDG